jgi:hypothetical protein
MRGGISEIIRLDKLEKLFSATFLEKSHQGAGNCFRLIRRDFGNVSFGLFVNKSVTITIDKGASDLTKLEIPSHVGVVENIHESTRCLL